MSSCDKNGDCCKREQTGSRCVERSEGSEKSSDSCCGGGGNNGHKKVECCNPDTGKCDHDSDDEGGCSHDDHNHDDHDHDHDHSNDVNNNNNNTKKKKKKDHKHSEPSKPHNKKREKSDACCGDEHSKQEKKKKPVVADKDGGGCHDSCCAEVGDDDTDNDNNNKIPVGKTSPPTGAATVTTTTTMSVVGMTCSDCANSAEKLLRKLPGVVSVDASFSASRVVVHHDASLVSASQLVERLMKLKFIGTIVSSGDERAVVSDAEEARRFVVALGKRSKTDVDAVVARMKKVSGIEGVDADDTGAHATVRIRDGFKRRDVVDALTSASLPSTLFDAASAAAATGEAAERAELRRWLIHVVLSTLMAIPLALMTFAFPDRIAPVVRLSVGFVLCSIVQIFTGAPLYTSAFAALRYTHQANVDCLVMLSTTVAYVYSTIVWIVWLANGAVAGQETETFFETPAILLALIVIGRYLEKRAKRSTGDALRSIRALQAPTAQLLARVEDVDNADAVRTLDCALIEVDDLLRIEPGATVPVDGVVVRGATTVDESMVTGESRAQTKSLGTKMLGGTSNIDGCVVLRATTTAHSSTVARIAQLMSDAQVTKPNVQLVADRVAAYFVPIIIVVSIVMFGVWLALIYGTSLIDTRGVNGAVFAMRFAIALLVVSCPCAVALSVPPVVVVSAGVAARNGLLVKDGRAFEQLYRVTDILFDKTGTITCGKSRVVALCTTTTTLETSSKKKKRQQQQQQQQQDQQKEKKKKKNITNVCDNNNNSTLVLSNVRALDRPLDFDANEDDAARRLLDVAGSVEGGSEHALARGIVQAAKEQLGADWTRRTTSEFRAIAGRGITCQIDGGTVYIGTPQLLSEQAGCDVGDTVRVEQAVREAIGDASNELSLTVVYASIGAQLLGAIALADVPRPESAAVVRWFAEQRGLNVWMVTGDNASAARSAAQAVGIAAERVVASVLPAGKADLVRQLQAKGAVVCHVGDGVNDAVALTQADVGIAMASSTDVASSAADVVLLKDELRDVVVLADVARAAVVRIRINLAWSFIYNLVAIPIAAGAFQPLNFVLPPALAGLSELLSSLPVIISALLLYRYVAPQLDIKQQQQVV